MSDAAFSYIRVELPRHDSDGMVTGSADKALISAALPPDTQLRQMLAFAHTLNEALDGLASEIAMVAGIDPDSEQITEAVYTCTDIDAAVAVLCPNMSRERQQ
jgi:hypothetical protein